MIRLFVLKQLTNVTDEQTDRQTPHDDIGRACIASRDKNRLLLLQKSCFLTEIRPKMKFNVAAAFIVNQLPVISLVV